MKLRKPAPSRSFCASRPRDATRRMTRPAFISPRFDLNSKLKGHGPQSSMQTFQTMPERGPECRPSAGHSVPQCPHAGQCRPTAGHSVPQCRPSAGTPCPQCGPVPAFRPSAGTPCPQCRPVPALLPCPQCPESPSARAGLCCTAAAGLAALTRR